MEEKFDMMLNNQAKMLEHLTILTKDVNQLKIGQKQLEEGQARLECRVTSLEEGQQELKKGQESLNKKVDFILDDNKCAKDNLTWLTKEYLHNKDKVEARLERIETQIA